MIKVKILRKAKKNMSKKTILTTVIFLVICLFGTVCFASAQNVMDTMKNSTVELKDEITQSIDKTQNSTRNVTQNVMNGAGNAMNTMGNMMDTNRTDNNNNRNNDNNNNNNNAGNYNTTRTAVNDGYFAGTGMDTTTWLWMILAIAAIIIIAAVWYYAMQGVHDDNEH